MNSKEFVQALVTTVHQPSIVDVPQAIERPPGRRPSEQAKHLSEWYTSLSDADKENLKKVIQISVHSALFGTLCVLDGVRAVAAAGSKVELSLVAITNGTSNKLNEEDGETLHDIYQALIYDQVFGT